jgi:hypothetical protein
LRKGTRAIGSYLTFSYMSHLHVVLLRVLVSKEVIRDACAM